MPQTHYIVYQNPESRSNVLIMNPSGDISNELLIQRNIPNDCLYTIIPINDFTYDLAYLDALSFTETGNLEINMTMARDIHRKYLRIEREPILKSLDVQYMRAIEMNDSLLQQEIANKKQKLRDITIHSLIEAAVSTLNLRILTIDYLLTNS